LKIRKALKNMQSVLCEGLFEKKRFRGGWESLFYVNTPYNPLFPCLSHLRAYVCLVLIMVISQDNMVGSSWGTRTNHFVQTDTSVSSFVPHHAIQNSQFPSGG
jgi:hypothetical protein